jgi:hypothetical protein
VGCTTFPTSLFSILLPESDTFELASETASHCKRALEQQKKNSCSSIWNSDAHEKIDMTFQIAEGVYIPESVAA